MTDSIQKVLVQMTHLEIFSARPIAGLDVKGWIANQNYLLDQNLTGTNFSISTTDQNTLLVALANDCNRMAMAAIESAAGVRCDDAFKKSGAWAIIRAYYAAFFAAHSIMRMYGISCCQLEQTHMNKLHQIADMLGKTGGVTKLEKGFYSIEIDKNYRNIIFRKYKDSHKDTWSCFLHLVNRISDEINDATALAKYKLEASDILLSIKHGITKGGCGSSGNWLSQIRNSVNYQHSYGTWFPYERRPISPSCITKLSEEWKKHPIILNHNVKKNDIESFFDITANLLSLFKTLLTSCANKSGSKNTVFSNGSIRQLNSIKIA